MKIGVWAACLVALASAEVHAQELAVGKTERAGNVIAGEVVLPSAGVWTVRQPAAGPLSQVFLVPPPMVQRRLEGERVRDVRNARQTRQGRWHVTQSAWLLPRYGAAHGGVGPGTVNELLDWVDTPPDAGGPDAALRAGEHELWDHWNRSPWPEGKERDVRGPFFFLVPNVPLQLDEDRWARADDEEAEPVILQLRPWVDDGKHWVLLSNGQAQRRAIDAELIKKHGLTVRAVMTDAGDDEELPAEVPYRLLAVARAGVATNVRLTLRNPATGAERIGKWDFADAAAAGGDELVKSFDRLRMASWAPLAMETDAPVLNAWCSILSRRSELRGLYEARARGGRERSTSVFNVLGGRAAVRETLQMQLVGEAATDAEEGANVNVADLPGVEVESHPYAEMLGEREGGRLPLADAVPTDRFFIHFARPAQMLKMLDGGSGFFARFGGTLTSNSIRRDLKGRYLSRLGLTESAARAFVESGLVAEVGVFCPDLFFIDGTDLTVLSRVPQMGLAAPLLAAMGAGGLADGRAVAVPTASGGKAWWTARGDLVVVSTSEAEMKRAAALIDAKGARSLGRSAEFRYMLTQLPPGRETAAYAYFSDAFIRRLVGPAVKIGQYRRAMARGALEALAAAALLHRADGNAAEPTVDDLVAAGLLPAHFRGEEYSLDEGGVPRSATWGTPGAMDTLLDHPVTTATPREADAYRSYVEGYTRFWRRFFDPIAVRLDLTGERSAELTTFILPLLHSRMYDGIREFVATRETAGPLRMPTAKPSPVLMASANLTPRWWTAAAEELEDMLRRYTTIEPSILDHLGPAVHLAVMDADPVVALGSGDMLGAFGAATAGRGEQMLAIPVMLSSLLRPCKLFVELDEPEQVLAKLRRSGARRTRQARSFWDFGTSFYKVAGRDAWVYSLEIATIIKLRYGIEVHGDYLVISNLPWGHAIEFGEPVALPLNGAGLQLLPGGVERELPALHTAAHDRLRAASMQGCAYLLPLMLAGAGTTAQAVRRHVAMLGFAPVHPPGGEWTWRDGQVVSDVYGSPARPEQPPYAPGERGFGLLGGIEKMDVSIQMEGTGLRALVRWTWRAAPAQ